MSSNSRVAVVTGASSGIGAATAQSLAADGYTVFNFDINDQEPAATRQGIEFLRCDVTNEQSVRAAVESVHRTSGRIDAAIANAGISMRRLLVESTEAEVRRVFDVNFFGVVNLWKQVILIDRDQRRTRSERIALLATASTNGSVGYPYYFDYNASKAAVLSLCRTIALEYADSVRTACVSPGYVLTDMQRAEYTEEMLAATEARIPFQRHADPTEIANAFRYLASADAAYLTGQQLVIDGGELAGGIASTFVVDGHHPVGA